MSLLSVPQIEQINRASLNLLESVGIKVDHPDVIRRLVSAGAVSDASGARVRIPRQLVADGQLAAGREPDEGKAATESTLVTVRYDDDALYVAFWCHDSQPEKIAAIKSAGTSLRTPHSSIPWYRCRTQRVRGEHPCLRESCNH